MTQTLVTLIGVEVGLWLVTMAALVWRYARYSRRDTWLGWLMLAWFVAHAGLAVSLLALFFGVMFPLWMWTCGFALLDVTTAGMLWQLVRAQRSDDERAT